MRHLVWDWNGTLLDDFPLVVEATNASLATVGGPAVTAEEHRRTFRRPLIDYYASVLGRPVTPAEFVDLDRAFHDRYRSGLLGCDLAADALAALRRGWAPSRCCRCGHTRSWCRSWTAGA
jgi:phosphoglycolate phosphatase-like HAD superfamily hydrolase